MKIIHKDKSYNFVYSDTSECWISEDKITINETRISFELYLKDFEQKNINWDYLIQFLKFIEGDLFDSLNNKSKKLLMTLVDVINWYKIIEDYRVEIESIFFKGKQSSMIFSENVFKYSFLYKLYNKNYAECDDPYGNFIVDIENGLITGCRREQV